MRQLGLQFKHPLHRVVPAFLERTGDEAIAGVRFLIAALCQVGFVAGTLDPSVPLRRDYSVTLLQISQRCQREFDRQRRDSSQQTFTNRVIKRVCRQAHPVWLQCLAMPPVALIDRVQAAIALIAHCQATPADAAKQHALKQTESFANGSSKDFVVGPVRCQASSIREELLPGNIAWIVISLDDAPLLLRHLAQPSADLASGVDLLTRLVATEYVSAGVRRIGKNADNSRMSQPAPDKLAIPGAAIRPTRKQKSKLMETLHHSVGGVLLFKQFEDCSNSALYFLVWVENDFVAVEYQTNRQRKTQLPLLRLIEFTAVEARG